MSINDLTVDPSEISFDLSASLGLSNPEPEPDPVDVDSTEPEPVSTEDPVEKGSYDDYSDIALSAKYLKDNGLLHIDDVPKDLTLDALVTSLKDTRQKESEYLREELLKEAGEFKNLMELRLLGVDPEVINDVVSVTGGSKLKVELTPEEENDPTLVAQVVANQEKVIRTDLSNRGIKDVDFWISTYKEKGVLSEKSLESKKSLQEEEDRITNLIKEDNLARQEAQIRYQEQTEKEFERVLSTKVVGGYKMNDIESNDLKKFIKDPSATVTFKDNTGKPISKNVTGFEKEIEEFKTNPEKQLAFALWLMKGASFVPIKNQGKVEQHDALFETIKKRASTTTTKPTNQKDSNDDDFLRSLLHGEYTN